MLSPRAEQVIHDYLNLPFKNIAGVRCPYFNNTRLNQRGQLRVLVGKGSPKDIVEEAHIISIQYHAGIFDRNGECCYTNEKRIAADDIRKFLVDNMIGIECSGFVTHVLRAHFKESKKIDLVKKLTIVSPKNILRWAIARFRPIENISVKTYADAKNSTRIIGEGIGYNYNAVQPGDLVIMLETGPTNKRNHILLITDNDGKQLNYVHARAWTSEGKYDHGVMRGTIRITHPQAPLLEQEWVEKGVDGEKNETFLEAKQAHTLEIRRLTL